MMWTVIASLTTRELISLCADLVGIGCLVTPPVLMMILMRRQRIADERERRMEHALQIILSYYTASSDLFSHSHDQPDHESPRLH